MPSASSRRKPSRSASTIVADKAGGYHDLKIAGYSRIKALPTGVPLRSIPFAISGHRWRIEFYPNGGDDGSADFVSLYLRLDEDVTREAMAQYQFTFMAEHRALLFRKRMEKVKSIPACPAVGICGSHSGFGFSKFVKRSFLEESSGAIKNDSLTIRCDVVVFNNLRPLEATTAEAAAPATFVPPPDLHRHLADLLQTGKGADVVFQIGGETLAAHRCVLAARSPVFSAELFGTTREGADSNTGGVVRVDDMEVQVFKALLCFLYTDSLPETMKKDEDVMYQHLLVAADRYDVERLKLICEDKLGKYIDVKTVATILTLAEQHNCHWLKKACLDFLSTPANLKAVMASGSFEHLSRSCPSLKTALIAILAT
ncbi:hypothetical protein U9M48_032638 [Paspalum notatum var. saurae]|uniref:Uncharacterized protein n=1 Tax=Paspalum notatum var. saurae TaxID=547442 RepID=A0AAQ3X5Z8_PASNO